jgi:hypothetical protein
MLTEYKHTINSTMTITIIINVNRIINIVIIIFSHIMLLGLVENVPCIM